MPALYPFNPFPLHPFCCLARKPSLWLKAICMCKYCKSIRDDDGDEEDYHLHLVTPQIRALTPAHAHTLTYRTLAQTSNYVEQSCKQILPVMRAANKNKYLHSIWRSLSPSLPLSLSLLGKGKLCVKSVGIFVNLKQQEPKPKPKAKPNPNQTRVKQSEASARQNRLPTD